MLAKYSIGIGDRFAHQAMAQLKAVIRARQEGVLITPVWNKSFREHMLIGSNAVTTREQADLAVRNLGWSDSYFVDADHINLQNVDFFMASCDFFTIDVAESIGKSAPRHDIRNFIKRYSRYCGNLPLTGLDSHVEITEPLIEKVARKYLLATAQAGEIYRHIKNCKIAEPFVVEVSMDETEQPQTPVEIFFILAALADQKIPLQTLAPKFSGRFNKGVDYGGDPEQFGDEFEQDIAIMRTAIKYFDLRPDLKLSVHSGSDKFSLYPVIRRIIRKHDAGLHLKTAGTTWLEELIGLAEAGNDGLELAKYIYRRSLESYDELCEPYGTVIDIDKSRLPSLKEVQSWDGRMFSSALRHDDRDKNYNPHFRQLLHVGYKIAAQSGELFIQALQQYRQSIEKNVTYNLFQRHIKPLFLD